MTTALQLYNIPAAIAEIVNNTGESGELTDEQLASLDALEMEFNDKAQACLAVRRGFELHADAIDAEIQRLQSLRSVFANRADRLKAYVKQCMEQANIRKIEGQTFTFWIQKNGQPSIEVSGEVKDLPEAFRREVVKVEILPNRETLIAAWKRDAEKGFDETPELPKGVRIECGSHLRIR